MDITCSNNSTMPDYQPKIQKFTGLENAMQWLKDYIAKIDGPGGPGQKHVYVSKCLEGTALDWYCHDLKSKAKVSWLLFPHAIIRCKPFTINVSKVKVLPNITPLGEIYQLPPADQVEDMKEGEEGHKSEKEVVKEVQIVTKQTDEDLTQPASMTFNWATDVNNSIGSIPIMSITVNPTLIDALTSVEPIPTIHTSQSSSSPITSAPILHGPRDLLGLWSGVRNPWGSLRHCNHCSYLPNVHCAYSCLEPI